MKVVPRSGRARLVVALAAVVLLLAPVAWMWWSSLLPDRYDIAEMGYADYGGGPETGHDHHGGTAVADLVADPDRPADVTETLTVATDGDRFTVNGTTPGPGAARDPGRPGRGARWSTRTSRDGTTLHWHGIDVPNAMDGVAGVTQDAVMPGESFTYRFVPDRAGTYWYHAHQVSHEQVRKGVLGAVVVEPRKTSDAAGRRRGGGGAPPLRQHADAQRPRRACRPSTCSPVTRCGCGSSTPTTR